MQLCNAGFTLQFIIVTIAKNMFLEEEISSLIIAAFSTKLKVSVSIYVLLSG